MYWPHSSAHAFVHAHTTDFFCKVKTGTAKAGPAVVTHIWPCMSTLSLHIDSTESMMTS